MSSIVPPAQPDNPSSASETPDILVRPENPAVRANVTRLAAEFRKLTRSNDPLMRAYFEGDLQEDYPGL